MLHLLIDIIRNSVLITGLVVVMMMMIESLNIESGGMLFKGLQRTKFGQVVIGAFLGSIPGCMGGFATVSLYTHRLFSFGALVAMMVASSGDEAFVMLAMIPDQALMMFAGLFILAILVGVAIDFVNDRIHKKHCRRHDHSDCGPQPDCPDGYMIHDEGSCCHEEPAPHLEGPSSDQSHGGASGRRPVRGNRTYGWKRITMFIGLAVFIAALATGRLGHDHSGHSHEGHVHTEACGGHAHEAETVENEAFTIDLLSEDWMNVLFAGLSVIVLFVLIFASDHFVEGHLWNHIVRKHLPTIFAWTFGVLLVLGIALQYMDIENWISGNTVLMILLATAVGIIPESGPHLIFVTLYAAGVVPFPVLLASSISQDGHASIPLLAESRRSFVWAKMINCGVALLAGFAAMLFL